MDARERPAVQWYVFAVASLATALLLRVSWVFPDDPHELSNAVTAFVILGVVAEAGFFRLRAEGITSSVAFVPFLAGVILFPPAWAMFVAGVAELVGETVIRRKPTIKVIHNSGKEIIAVGVAGLAYGALGGSPSYTVFGVSAVGFLAATTLYFLISEGTPVLAIALDTGSAVRDTWLRLVGSSLVYDMVAGPIAVLLAWFFIKLSLVGVLIVTVPLFFVRHVYQMNLRLEQVNADLLELMVKAIEARDPYTSGHSLRVSRLTRAIATSLGLGAKRVEEIATAALLHDVGKIYEEFAALLRKEGRLLPHEQRMMQSHPVRSAELVSTISTLRGAVELAVRHHHEAYNGTGYPDGLVGEDIPIGSRIIAIADTVDAMTTDRPYRQAMPYSRVTEELRSYAGRQFDPALVELFCTDPQIQAVVETHLPFPNHGQLKTVGETFDDLRRALGQLPSAITDAPATRWSRKTGV